MKPFAIHHNSAVIYFLPEKQFRYSTAIPLEFMSEFSSELQMALPKILLWIGVKCRFSRWSTVFAVWEGPAVSTTTTDFFLSSLYRWHFLRTILMDLCFLVKNFLEIFDRSWEHLPNNPENCFLEVDFPFLCCVWWQYGLWSFQVRKIFSYKSTYSREIIEFWTLMKSRGGWILQVDLPFKYVAVSWWILEAYPISLCSKWIKSRVVPPLF